MSFGRPATAQVVAVAKSEPWPIVVSEYVYLSASSFFFYKR